MSLTADDLSEIRDIVESAIDKQARDIVESAIDKQARDIVESANNKQTEEFIKPIQNELQAIRNDIEEIYDMISDLRHSAITDRKFSRLSLESKILTLNAELVSAAKQAGIDLPR